MGGWEGMATSFPPLSLMFGISVIGVYPAARICGNSSALVFQGSCLSIEVPSPTTLELQAA